MKKILKILWSNLFTKVLRSKVNIYLGFYRSISLKKESDLYTFALKNCVLYNQSNYNNSINHIRNKFKKYNIIINIFLNQWWLDFIKASRMFDKNSRNKQKRLILEIEEKLIERVKIRDYLHFNSLALRFGLFNIAYSFRCKAREAVINSVDKKSKNKTNLIYG